ncbi:MULTISPECIES: hypothetical protein [unclassified Paraburkholderia]|uniref:hypothetical protein n=1 Tax=unclassified Paraburkholderia TaxID=2615204 RepID=UPI002AB1F99E|nr:MULTISPECIES: hypothetical protein [unclassified Paraburkholderia]
MDETTGGDAGGAGGGVAAAATGSDGGNGAAAAATQESAPSFLETLGDADLKAYAESKGYKTAAEAIKSFRDTETANAAPAKAEDYKLPVPDGQSDALAKQAATWFHEAGVSQKTAEALVTKFNAHVAGLNEAAVAAQKQLGETQMAALQKEWGSNYDANIELGRKALLQFGVPREVSEDLEKAVGAAQILKTFSKIGAALSEGVLNAAGGGSEGGGAAPLDPDQARAQRMFKSSAKKG